METFKIEIQEFLARVVEVEAESVSDAVSKINKKYQKAEIILDYNDFVEVEFADINIQSENDEKNMLMHEIIAYLLENKKKYFDDFLTNTDNHIYQNILRLKELLSD